MKAHISSWSSGLIFVQPFDCRTCEQMAVLSSGSSNAALLGDAALTCLLHMSNDNPSADAMAFIVGLVEDPSEVEEGNAARTMDLTSDLLSLAGLPFGCFVQVASLIVSLMLLMMCSLVGTCNNPALADSSRISMSLITDLKIHA